MVFLWACKPSRISTCGPICFIFFQDKSFDPWKEKFKNDDGIELMIPAHNKDFLPEIIYTMIKDNKVDIEAEYVFKPSLLYLIV